MLVSARLRRWLTGPKADPSVRLRFLEEVERRPEDDPKVRAAADAVGRSGWAAGLLSYQMPDGHWVTPGSSARELYLPKYLATNWVAIVLADLGMTRRDPRIRRTAELILDRWGQANEDLSGTTGEVCVTGNAVRTLLRFGYGDHPVVLRSLEWLVRTQRKDGGWYCAERATGSLDCWEGLAALAEIPEGTRSAAVRESIAKGAEFYLKRNLLHEGPVRYPPWFRIHYPNHYYYDLLVGLRLLTRLGYGKDPRLGPALRWLREKRRTDGTWALDAAHPDNDPARGGYEFGQRLADRVSLVFPMLLEPLHVPSRWATVEALSILRRVESNEDGPRDAAR